MTRPKAFSAIMLQYVMIGIISLCLTGIVLIFFSAQSILSDKVTETDHAHTDAELAQEEIASLQRLKKNLEQDSATIQKTAQIVASSQQYTYQDQVIKDITGYAKDAGVSIKGFDFGIKPGETPVVGAKNSGSTQRRTAVGVTLEKGATMTSLLRFIRSIEKNLTKMQLTGLDIKPNDADRRTIQESLLNIEVYLR